MQIARLVISSFALAGLVAAQPILRIISPAEGATVHPGESLNVDVEAIPPEAFELVFVAGAEPISFSKEKLSKPPYRFTVQIPTGIRPDKYPITAAGFALPTGQLIISSSIKILIERSDSPVGITVYPVVADFTMDQKRYIQVTGLYAD
jgi:hypothetical protein